jgi:hypothetical protein
MTGAFPQSFERHGYRYTLLEPLHHDRARFLFTGPFQGRDIQWDATLSRLTDIDSAPYIDIGGESGHGRILNVALAIPAVFEPALLGVFILIRQYKRLRPGRHVFGEPSLD